MPLPTADFDTHDWEAGLSSGWPEENLTSQHILNLAIRTAFLKADSTPNTVNCYAPDEDVKFGPADFKAEAEAEGQYTSLNDRFRCIVELPTAFMLQVEGEEEKVVVQVDMDSIRTLSRLTGRSFQDSRGDVTRRNTVMQWPGQAWTDLAQSVSERGQSDVKSETRTCDPSVKVLEDSGSTYICIITHPSEEAVIKELELQWRH